MIEEKKKELVRMLRLYFLGVVDSKQVKNTFNCLVVDVMLDEKASRTAKGLSFREDRTFEQLWKEMME